MTHPKLKDSATDTCNARKCRCCADCEIMVPEMSLTKNQPSADVIDATQLERQRLSRVLHDDLQQRVFAIQMQMSFLKEGLSSENDSAQKEASEIERELAEITRNLSIDMSPPILPGEGLSHAIEWFATRMREQFGLPVEVQANGPSIILHENLHVFLFNCVRELLFNVVKHAGASRAVIVLELLDDHLQIKVSDDGKGFPVNTSEESMGKQDHLPRSLGLPDHSSSIEPVWGRMEINSKPGAGTQVTLVIPVAEVKPGV